MAVRALTNAYAYVGSHDFTGDSNSIDLKAEGDALDSTTFRSAGWREHVIGLKSVALDMKGFAQYAASDAVDPDVFNNLGTSQVFTIADVETEDQPAYAFQAAHYSLEQFGNLGELAPFSLAAQCKDSVGVVAGKLAKAKGVVSATGATGTGVLLGAVGATQYLYATLHVFGTPGTTITAVVESDDASNFPSATTRITFGPITTAGGTWGTRVAGAITDSYFRLRVTAITGSFTVACAIAVQ